METRIKWIVGVVVAVLSVPHIHAFTFPYYQLVDIETGKSVDIHTKDGVHYAVANEGTTFFPSTSEESYMTMAFWHLSKGAKFKIQGPDAVYGLSEFSAGFVAGQSVILAEGEDSQPFTLDDSMYNDNAEVYLCALLWNAETHEMKVEQRLERVAIPFTYEVGQGGDLYEQYPRVNLFFSEPIYFNYIWIEHQAQPDYPYWFPENDEDYFCDYEVPAEIFGKRLNLVLYSSGGSQTTKVTHLHNMSLVDSLYRVVEIDVDQLYWNHDPQAIVTEITLDEEEITLAPGATYQLKASIEAGGVEVPIRWESDNTDVVAVDYSGLVQAKSLGDATITAYPADMSGLKAYCAVTVDDNVGVEDLTSEQFNVSVLNRTIHIESAEGQPIDVYSMDGKRIYHGSNPAISIPAPGIYLVKIHDRVIKIIIP